MPERTSPREARRLRPAPPRRARTEGAPFDPKALDDLDLVAQIVAQVGWGDRLGRDRARDRLKCLLRDSDGLGSLRHATFYELEAAFTKLGDEDAWERARMLASALELGRRLSLANVSPPPRIRDERDVGTWGMEKLGALEHEELWMLAVDGQGRLRTATRVAQGGLHGASVRAADPLRHALRAAASGFVLVHNHPSGDPTPSIEDVRFTVDLARAAAVVGVPLLDHVVVSATSYARVSFGEAG